MELIFTLSHKLALEAAHKPLKLVNLYWAKIEMQPFLGGEMLETDQEKLDGLRTYIDGKMRRYGLLFSVNGGALAIAQLKANDDTAKLLGQLSVTHLALGAIVFTIVMVVDIWLFGQMMRNKFLGELAFSKPGKTILLMLGLLLVSGWLLVVAW